MNRVTTINLSGTAYSLEEPGYEALSRYLSDAEARLEGNPDKHEIVSDLESAIGQKCSARLSASKSVLTTADIEEILKEMGPVSAEGGETEGEPKTSSDTKDAPRKRLYQIHEGAMIGGVCTGLAAYFNIDVTLIRIAFVLLTIFTTGAWILAYILMMLILPVAVTPAEQAQAHGVPPITAQMLMGRARAGYQNFRNSREWYLWKRQMHSQQREWKRKWKHEWKHHNSYAHQPAAYPRSPFWEFMQGILGLVWFVVVLSLGYWAYNHIPPFHNLINNLPHYWQMSVDWLSTKIAENQ